MDDTFRRGPLLLLSGRANHPLALEIGELIGKSPDAATIRQFADGEIFVRIDRNARGRDVFIVQPTVAPADNIMELLLLIDAAHRASAARVTAVVPYFGYARQDARKAPGEARSAQVPHPALPPGCRRACRARHTRMGPGRPRRRRVVAKTRAGLEVVSVAPLLGEQIRRLNRAGPARS